MNSPWPWTVHGHGQSMAPAKKKEREKLAPEARKQRRASETLKMTPKSQLYVFLSFLVTIALTIERKELAPEGRKKRELLNICK